MASTKGFQWTYDGMELLLWATLIFKKIIHLWRMWIESRAILLLLPNLFYVYGWVHDILRKLPAAVMRMPEITWENASLCFYATTYVEAVEEPSTLQPVFLLLRL